MPSDRRRVVVVGGQGYVGGRVAANLAEEGWDVVVTGRAALDLQRDDDARVDEVLGGATAVVNLVARNEHQAADDPALAQRVAVEAARRVGCAVLRLQIPRMLHFSTVHVYGAFRGEIDEDTRLGPIHPYGAAHAAGEEALRETMGATGHATVLRMSNAIGPPVRAEVDRWTLVTNDLARTWAETGRIVLRSAGAARRDFIALTDVCRAVAHLLDSTAPLPPVLHVCSCRNLTVGEVAERMATLAEGVTGTRPPVERPAGADAGPPAPAFRLSNARLLATGFRLLDCFDEELQALLLFAQRHFGAAA